ncbi:VWA domain-containing protein [Candidatus Riflebacteria bacterium]
MIQFFIPTAFYLGISIPLLILLYTIKSHPTMKKLPSIMIWKRVLKKKPPQKALFKNFIHSPFFLIHLLFLIFLISTLAQPYLPFKSNSRVVYLIDNSISMQYRDVMPDRFSRAKEALIQHIKFNNAQSYSLLTFASKLQPVLLDIKDETEILFACKNLEVGNIPGGSPQELENQLEAFLPENCSSIFVFSDNVRFSRQLAGKVQNSIEYFYFGKESQNLSLLHIDGFSDGDVFKARLTVGNSSRSSQSFQIVVLNQFEKELHRLTGKVEGSSRWRSPIFPILAKNKTDYLSIKFENIENSEDNLFSADDTIFWNFNMPKVPFNKKGVIPVEVERLLKYFPLEILEKPGLPVISTFTPAKLPKSDGIFFIDTYQCKDTVSKNIKIHFRGHPLIQYCHWDLLKIENRWTGNLDDFKPLISDEKGPLLGFREFAGTRQILFLFTFKNSDFQKRISFPIFIKNSLEWISGKNLDVNGLLRLSEKEKFTELYPDIVNKFKWSLANPSESNAFVWLNFSLKGLAGKGNSNFYLEKTRNHSWLILLGIFLSFLLYLADCVLFSFTSRIGV